MPLGKLKQDYVPLPQAKLTVARASQGEGFTAVPSPARSLQEQLEIRAVQALPVVEKWSPRRALVFIAAASATLWMALIIAGAQVAQAVA